MTTRAILTAIAAVCTLCLIFIPWLVVSGVVPSQNKGTFKLMLLHNNDIHGVFAQTVKQAYFRRPCYDIDPDEKDCYGGVARIVSEVKKYRETATMPVLFLNSGDTYTGGTWFPLYLHTVAAEFTNLMKPDAMSLGNHEFDKGVAGLVPFIKSVSCPILAANLDITKEDALKNITNFYKSKVFEKNNTKIGVIGYVTPETNKKSTITKIKFEDEVEAIKKEVHRLKNEGVNIFIALGHSGYERDKVIAEKVEDIDLVVGGHSHTFLSNCSSTDQEEVPEGDYPTIITHESGKYVPIVQAYAYSKYLGKLVLEFNETGDLVDINATQILLDKSVPQDPDVMKLVDKYRTEISNNSTLNKVYGISEVVLDESPDTDNYCRVQECIMGNLITDSMVYKYQEEYKLKGGVGRTDAPIAIIQGGGFRPLGKIKTPFNLTYEDFTVILPYDKPLFKVPLDGKTIKSMLEYSVNSTRIYRSNSKYVNPGAPQFLQLSGMKVEYDLNKPIGERVVKVLVHCGDCELGTYKLLNESVTYNVIMNKFLTEGDRDGYTFAVNEPVALGFTGIESLIKFVSDTRRLNIKIDENSRRIILHNLKDMDKLPHCPKKK